MRICAVIPAAGSGSRAGFSENKILHKTGGTVPLFSAVSAFAANARVDTVAVCVRECDRAAIEKLLAPFENVVLVAGGDTRTQSVKNALEAFAKEQTPPDYVLIHDAARPFLSQKVIDGCIDTARSFGSAVCALPCTDTAVLAESGFVSAPLPREKLYTVQTPQGFAFGELLSAYRRIGPDETFTDDSGVFAKYVAPPRLFDGERANIKLTFREDFSMQAFRTGIGTDTHAFCEGDHVILGGVRIPHGRALSAHSDGDVLAHAVMDAMLSAAGLCDIGHYFPDTDPAYKGADSLALLKKVVSLVKKEGFCVGNVSAAIVAQSPRLAPFIPHMKQNLADVLNIFEQCIGISAGTNEGLGYIGRGEGISVTASVLLRSCGE